MKSTRRKIVPALSWNAIGTIVVRAIDFGRVALVARLLTAEDLGLFGMAIVSLSALAVLSEFGLAHAFIARKIQSEREEQLWLDTVWTADLCLKVALVFALLLAAYPASLYFNDQRLFFIIVVLGVAPVIEGVRSAGLTLLHKRADFQKIILLEVLSGAIGTCVSVSLVYFYRSVWSLVIGYVCSALITTILSYLICQYRPRFVLDRVALNELFRYGKPIMFVALLTFLTTQFDDLVVASELGTAALGIYLLAYKLTSVPVSVFGRIFGRSMFPIYSEAAITSRSELVRLWSRTYGYLSWLLGAMLLPLALYSDYVVVLVFGKQWSAAAPVVEVLVLLSVFRGLAHGLSVVLLALSFTEVDKKYKILEVLFFIPATIVGVKYSGAIGVAWAGVLAYGLAFVLRTVYVARYFELPFRSMLKMWIGPLCAATLAAAIAFYLQMNSVDEVIGIVAVVCCFGVMLLALDPVLRGRLRIFFIGSGRATAFK